MKLTDHKIRRFSAGDVLDQRADIADRLVHSEKFADLITGTLSVVNGKIDPTKLRNVQHLPKILYVHLMAAEAFRVSADMVTLISHAAALLDDTDQFHASMLPTKSGFVRFDQPLILVDVRGNEMLVHAITWGPAPTKFSADAGDTEWATLFTMWNDVDVQTDAYSTTMLQDLGTVFRKVNGRWSFIGAEILVEGARMGPPTIDPAGRRVDDDVTTTQPFTNTFRYFQALCMLMDQTIVTKSSERPNVHARRRAKDRKMSQSDITVVTLRRRSVVADDTTTTGESGREWHHRWVVRGHWRWARVGAGRQEIRRVWVAGHVKGPEDKPLKITQKVYDLKR